MQLTHDTTNFIKKTFHIALLCDNITNAANIGSIFRIADAFGIEKLILCGPNIPLGRKITKTSRSTEKHVPFETQKSTHTVVKSLKNQGYQILSLELTSTSQSLYTSKFKIKKPIALVVGNENFGVCEDVLKSSDDIIHIEMYGNNSSMNVVQATSIALYEIVKQMQSQA